MYHLVHYFNHCQSKLKTLDKLCYDLDRNQSNPDISKCENLLERLYYNGIDVNGTCKMTMKYSNIVHMQHVLLVSAHNLLVNEKGKRLDTEPRPDPILLDINFKNFAVEKVFENLEKIFGRKPHIDLLKKKNSLQEKSDLDDEDQLVLMYIQKEAIDRTLKELRHLSRKRQVHLNKLFLSGQYNILW
jgi:hypothetical protein